MEEIFSQLDVLVRQGKILYVGTSKWPVPLIMEGLMEHIRWGYPRIVAEQPPYNLCDRSIEMELVWACMRQGIALITWAPLASGILSGIYRKGEPVPPGHRYSKADPNTDWRFTNAALELVEKLIPIAQAKAIDLPALAHAWLQQRPGITCPIIGPRTVRHLRAALKTVDIAFTKEELDSIDAVAPPGSWVSNYYYDKAYGQLIRRINDPKDPTAY